MAAAEQSAQEMNSGTKEVDERYRLDEARLAAWLRDPNPLFQFG